MGLYAGCWGARGKVDRNFTVTAEGDSVAAISTSACLKLTDGLSSVADDNRARNGWNASREAKSWLLLDHADANSNILAILGQPFKHFN
jgi:hypothetical protein